MNWHSKCTRGWRPETFEQLFLDETLGDPMCIVILLARHARAFDDVIKFAIRKFGLAKAGNWHSREKANKHPEVAQFIIRRLVKQVEAGEAAIMLAYIESVGAKDLTNEAYNAAVARALTGTWKYFPTARPLIGARYGQVWEKSLREALAIKVAEVAKEILGTAPFDVETIKNAQVLGGKSSGLQVADTVAWVVQRRGDKRFQWYQRMIDQVRMKPDLKV